MYVIILYWEKTVWISQPGMFTFTKQMYCVCLRKPSNHKNWKQNCSDYVQLVGILCEIDTAKKRLEITGHRQSLCLESMKADGNWANLSPNSMGSNSYFTNICSMRFGGGFRTYYQTKHPALSHFQILTITHVCIFLNTNHQDLSRASVKKQHMLGNFSPRFV